MKNKNNKKDLGCYVMFTNRLFLSKLESLARKRQTCRSTAKVSTKIVQEQEIAKYRVTFCQLPLMFNIAENNFSTLIFLDVFQRI